MSVGKFRKKPVVIEALQFTGWNQAECIAFCPSARPSLVVDRLIIPTLEGDHTCRAQDWIIKGVKSEFYPCKPDIFAATYDAVPEPAKDEAKP